MTVDILDRIDAAINGQCPCGDVPRPDSAYCSDDCVPTWRGADTTSHLDGTAMRWRPNMPPAVTRIDLIDPAAVAELGRHTALAAEALCRMIAGLAESLRPALENLRKFQELHLNHSLPSVAQDHPLARALARRTDLVHGPHRPERPPRKLEPRR